MEHQPNCRWELCNCEYKKTHEYCPHSGHACNCNGQKSVQHEELEKVINKIILPLSIKIDTLSIKIGKSRYQPNYNDSREINLIYKDLENLPVNIASTILSYGYVKKSDLVIDKSKLKKLVDNEILGVFSKIEETICTNFQELIKIKEK